MTTVGLALGPGARASTVVAASQITDSDWSSLPLVYGEPEARKVEIPQNLLIATQDVNFRTEPSTRGGSATAILIKQGSLLELIAGEEEITDLDGTTRYIWAGANLVYDASQDEVLQGPKHGYIAHDFFAPAVDEEGLPAVDLPDTLVAIRYQELFPLPEAARSMAVASFLQWLSNQPLDESLLAGAAAAWELVTTEDESHLWDETTDSPLQVWQLATYMAARHFLSPSVTKNFAAVDLGEVVTSNTSFTLIVHATGEYLDVMTRLSDADNAEPDIFVVVRSAVPPRSSGAKEAALHFSVGFVTWEGLVSAYGAEQATAMAGQMDTLQGDAAELAEAIAALPVARLFLPAMPVQYQFVKKLERPRGFTLRYHRFIDEYGFDYRAQVVQQSGKVQVEQVYLAVSEQEGNWFKLPKLEDVEQAIAPYLTALTLQEKPEEISQRLRFRAKQMGTNPVVNAYDPATEVPLLTARIDGSKIEYQAGLRPLVELSGKHFGFFIDPKQHIEVLSTTYIVHEADTLVSGAFSHALLTDGPEPHTIKDLNNNPASDVDTKQVADIWIQYAQSNGMRMVAGNALIDEAGFGPSLRDDKMPVVEYRAQLLQWVEETIQAFPGVEAWTVANELVNYYSDTRQFANTVAQSVTSDDAIDFEFFVELYEAARTAAGKVEKLTGKKIRLGINDHVAEIELIGGKYLRDNSVSGPQADGYFDVVTTLAKQGLIDFVGIQLHLHNPGRPFPTAEEITRMADRYHGIVDVEITALDLHQDLSYEPVVKALLASTAVKGITVWGVNQEAGWSGDPTIHYLFADNKPNHNYYQVCKAFADHIYTLQ